MRKMLVVVLVVVFGISCAVKPSPQFDFQVTPPSNMVLALGIRSGDWIGLGAPISSDMILTAHHVVDERLDAVSADPSKHLVFRVTWRHPKIDIAVLRVTNGSDFPVQTPFMSWYTIARKLPEETELLYYRCILDKTHKMATMVGRFVGIDNDGDLVIDGFTYAGMSGGPVVNSRGELVGLIRATSNPGGDDYRYRALGIAVNLVGRDILP